MNTDSYSTREAAKLLGYKSISTLHNHINAGYIKAYRVAEHGHYRIPATEIDRLKGTTPTS